MTYQDALNVDEARREELIKGLRVLVRNRPFEQTLDGRDKDWIATGGPGYPIPRPNCCARPAWR